MSNADKNCNGSVHCLGNVYSEAIWSLYKRTLRAAPYNYDENTALEIVTRLTYIAGKSLYRCSSLTQIIKLNLQLISLLEFNL